MAVRRAVNLGDETTVWWLSSARTCRDLDKSSQAKQIV